MYTNLYTNLYTRFWASVVLVALTFTPLAHAGEVGEQYEIKNRIVCQTPQAVHQFFELATVGMKNGWNIQRVMRVVQLSGMGCGVASGTVTYVGAVETFVHELPSNSLTVHIQAVNTPTGETVYVWATEPAGDPA